jgi:hypothetical protein
LFLNTPQFDKGAFGTGLNKKYLNSIIEIDKLSEFFADKQKFESKTNKNHVERKTFEETKTNPIKKHNGGFCIRTGVEIPFNIEKPMSYEAYKSWNKNPENPELFCHYSGEPSDGKTSVSKPILGKNWSKAKSQHGL